VVAVAEENVNLLGEGKGELVKYLEAAGSPQVLVVPLKFFQNP
jgi:hypothetical protein